MMEDVHQQFYLLSKSKDGSEFVELTMVGVIVKSGVSEKFI